MKRKFLSFASLPGSALAALLLTWALSISFFNTYGLFSKRAALLLGLLFVILTACCYLILARVIQPRWKNAQFRQPFLGACVLLLLIGFALASEASQAHPYNVFILPTHTLKISIPEQQAGRQFHLVWFKTGFREVGNRELKLEGKWEAGGPAGGYQLSTSQPGAAILWRGVTGDELTVVMQAGPGGGAVELTLDGKKEVYSLDKKDASGKTIVLKTPVPVFFRVLGVGLTGLLIASGLLAVLLGIAWLTRGVFPGFRPDAVQYFPLNRKHLVILTLLITVAGFSAIHLYNNILPWLNLTSYTEDPPTKIFSIQPVIRVMKPVGIDFRYGLYYPTQDLLANGDMYDPNGVHRGSLAYYTPQMYPPLIHVLALPYMLFPEDRAYELHVAVLYALNLACLILGAYLLKKYVIPLISQNDEQDRLILVILFAAVAFYGLNTYGFLFSVERGNVDILALFYALLGLLCLLAAPKQIWLQVILLSIATHIKVYPAILFALLFFKHRWKIVIPTLVVNLAFLLVIGPGSALGFFKNLLYMNGDPAVWIGNHSGVSFASLLISGAGGQFFLNQSAAGLLFTALPLIIWAAAMLVLFFRGDNPLNVIWGLLISIPVMDLVPGRSHDYRLVIENTAFLILLAIIVLNIIRSQKWYDYLQLLLLIFLIGTIGRSYAVFPPELALLANKYIPVLLFEILIFLNLVRPLNTAPSQHSSFKLIQ